MKIPEAKTAVEKEWENSRKHQHGNWQRVRNKREVIDEAWKEGKTIHVASLMDICHLKNWEWNPTCRSTKGRVVLRGDIVKDDSSSYAAFTEQGSSASQMTEAEVMDVIARLPGCAGQAADAVSAYTQVKMEDAPTLSKFPKSECSYENMDIKIKNGYVSQNTSGPNLGPVWKTQSSPWAKSVRSYSGRTVMGKAIRESSVEARMGKSSELGVHMLSTV